MGELETHVRQILEAFDRPDVEAASRFLTRDTQGVDEISGRWLRGDQDVRDYLEQLPGLVSGVRSTIRDFDERVWDDTGVATFWLEQDYTMEGQQQHVSAPTSIVFRRQGGDWKVALYHSIPLPERSQP